MNILDGPAIVRRLASMPALRPVLDEARRFRRPVWLVGGLVRDCALGLRGAADADLAVQGSAARLAEHIAKRLHGSFFALDEATRVYRVAAKARGSPLQIDVAQVQGRGIGEDLGRRDFTVNALAVEVGGGELLDPHGGLEDLRRARLRTVSSRAFPEDPLRLLRAFRLAARLGLSMDPETLAGVRAHRRLLSRVAGERIRAELLALLSVPDSASWLRLMDKAGLLTALFPELKPARRCAEVYYGKGGVLKHSLDAVARLDLLLANLRRIYPRLGADLLRHLDARVGGREGHGALLRLAVLLHDVAKPECAKRLEGRLRFFGHEARGAEAAGRILRRLRFSAEEVRLVEAAVLHHLRPGNLAAGGALSDKAVFRYFRDLGSHGVSSLLVCWADHASYLGPQALRAVLPLVRRDPRRGRRGSLRGPRAKTLYHLQVVSFLLARNFTRPETVRPERLLDGNQVMKALSLAPGPRVGEILRSLEEAQAEGKVKNRPQALAFIRRLNI